MITDIQYPAHWQKLLDRNPTMWLHAEFAGDGTLGFVAIDHQAPTPAEVTPDTEEWQDQVAHFALVSGVWAYCETPTEEIAYMVTDGNILDIHQHVLLFMNKIATM